MTRAPSRDSSDTWSNQSTERWVYLRRGPGQRLHRPTGTTRRDCWRAEEDTDCVRARDDSQTDYDTPRHCGTGRWIAQHALDETRDAATCWTTTARPFRSGLPTIARREVA